RTAVRSTLSLHDALPILTDVLEYSKLESADGAVIDMEEGQIFSWGQIEISPDESVTKTVTVRVLEDIPASPRPSNNLESNNLELDRKSTRLNSSHVKSSY